MEQLSKVTKGNRNNFYSELYEMQHNGVDALINLDQLPGTCALIDCCGWHYRSLFASKIVVTLETITAAREYQYPKQQVDYLIDNQTPTVAWPTLETPVQTLVFDRSPMLKYATIEQLTQMLNSVAQCYNPKEIVIRHSLLYLDDNRLTDRFYNFQQLQLQNYTVYQFEYNCDTLSFTARFQCYQ